jgi:ABC-2 type transport system ATP-binding protein
VGSVLLEVAGRAGSLDAATVQRRLEQVNGVSRVVLKRARDDRSTFEVESQRDHAVRGDLARAVVEAGWDLNELRSAAISLEEVFLQLTSSEAAGEQGTQGAPAELEAVAGKAQE